MQLSDRNPRVQNLFIGPNVYLSDSIQPYIQSQQQKKTNTHKHTSTHLGLQQSNSVFTTFSPIQTTSNFKTTKKRSTNNLTQKKKKFFNLSASTAQFKKLTECTQESHSYTFIQKALDNLREQKSHTLTSLNSSIFKQKEDCGNKITVSQVNPKFPESKVEKQKYISKIKLLENDNLQLKSKIIRLEELLQNKLSSDESPNKQKKTYIIQKEKISQLEEKIDYLNQKILRVEDEKDQLILQNKRLLEVFNLKQYDETKILQQKVLKLEDEINFLKDQAIKNFSIVSMNVKKNLAVESMENSRLSDYQSSLTPQDLAKIKSIASQYK